MSIILWANELIQNDVYNIPLYTQLVYARSWTICCNTCTSEDIFRHDVLVMISSVFLHKNSNIDSEYCHT